MNNLIVLSKCVYDTAETGAKTFACKGVVGEKGIPGDVVNLITTAYRVLEVLVPLVLIIMGMISLVGAITSQKDDEIKKATSNLFKKIIIAVVVLIVFTLVDFVFHFVQGEETLWTCIKEIISGNCS